MSDTQAYWAIDGTTVTLLDTQPVGQPGESETYGFALYPLPAPTPSVRERYATLRSRWRHANTVTIETTIHDEVRYAETLDGDSALVGLVPGRRDDLGRGFWGLIVGGEDGTEAIDDSAGSETTAYLSLEIVYIAPYERYADKAAVRDTHERQGFQ